MNLLRKLLPDSFLSERTRDQLEAAATVTADELHSSVPAIVTPTVRPQTFAEPFVEHLADWHRHDVSIDPAGRVVRNIVLVGGHSRNGHRYTETALQEAVRLYAGKPVFLDHAADRNRPRDRSTRDLVGVIEAPRFEKGLVRGDVRVYDTDAGRTFLALCSGPPTAIGMSHVALGQRGADPLMIERLHDVISVDAVVFPATTNSLHEQTSPLSTAPELAVLATRHTSAPSELAVSAARGDGSPTGAPSARCFEESITATNVSALRSDRLTQPVDRGRSEPHLESSANTSGQPLQRLSEQLSRLDERLDALQAACERLEDRFQQASPAASTLLTATTALPMSQRREGGSTRNGSAETDSLLVAAIRGGSTSSRRLTSAAR